MKNVNTGEAFLVALVFIINPLLGIFLASLIAIGNKSIDGVKPLMVFAILYLCALNTTKVPESDMVRYLQQYELVPSVGYWETVMWAGTVKDILYSTLVYLLYYATFGNHYFFIIVITFIEYWFIFMAIYKFGKEYNLPKYIIVVEVLILSFFVQFFSLTLHLIRQMLATCIFFYALTFRNTSIKKFWLFSIVAMGFHSSVGVLVLLSVIPATKRRLKSFEIGYLILFALFFVVILSFFAHFILGSFDVGGSVEYTLSRAANMEGAQDNTAGMSRIGLVFSIATIILCMIERGEKKEMKYPVIVNIAFVMAFIVVGLSASPLIQYRFFFFLYSFFPLLLPLFMRKNEIVSKTICIMAVALMMVWFYARLNHVFEYAPVEEALLYPYPMLIQLS